jgi:anaerobic selenocysteine-containing dehydrogenase
MRPKALGKIDALWKLLSEVGGSSLAEIGSYSSAHRYIQWAGWRNTIHSDCIVFEGSIMAEGHLVAFRWPMQAKLQGATLIHVDPHFTRTSAMRNPHAPVRAGSDIAFLGGPAS